MKSGNYKSFLQEVRYSARTVHTCTFLGKLQVGERVHDTRHLELSSAPNIILLRFVWFYGDFDELVESRNSTNRYQFYFVIILIESGFNAQYVFKTLPTHGAVSMAAHVFTTAMPSRTALEREMRVSRFVPVIAIITSNKFIIMRTLKSYSY